MTVASEPASIYTDVPVTLTAKDLERLLQVSKQTSYWVLRQLPTITIGRARRATRQGFLAWLEANAK